MITSRDKEFSTEYFDVLYLFIAIILAEKKIVEMTFETYPLYPGDIHYCVRLSVHSKPANSVRNIYWVTIYIFKHKFRHLISLLYPSVLSIRCYIVTRDIVDVTIDYLIKLFVNCCDTRCNIINYILDRWVK